jgi:RNA polymerase sigma-70 factor (ECF subfamily)
MPVTAGSVSAKGRDSLVVSESSARKYALDPEVRLMLEVRDDKAAAFEELVLRYQSRLVTFLKHLVGDAHQAEDLAQEVFLRVYKSRKSYEPGAKFATWLFTITNNVAANALRTRNRHPEVLLAPMGSGSMGVTPLDVMLQASSGQMPARQLAKAEIRDVVRMALQSLGERQKLAVLLNKFENLSYAEIAEIMNISTQAVKSLLSRARVNLQQVLQPYIEQGERPSEDGRAIK